jgi:hypothetical protein
MADPATPVPASGAGGVAAASPRPGRPRVLAAAVEPVRRAAVIEKLNQVVAAGGTGVLVTADAAARAAGLDPRVETIDLAAGERRLGLNRLLAANPAWLMSRLTRTGKVGASSPVWVRVRQSKPYRMIRPWLYWRVLRRRLGEVRVDELDHVLIVHQNSWPIAWQLHRRNPTVSISFEVPDDVWRRAGRPVPGREGDAP